MNSSTARRLTPRERHTIVAIAMWLFLSLMLVVVLIIHAVS